MLRICPKCQQETVAKVDRLVEYRSYDPDDEDSAYADPINEIELSIDFEFPECQNPTCHWNHDMNVSWDKFEAMYNKTQKPFRSWTESLSRRSRIV